MKKTLITLAALAASVASAATVSSQVEGYTRDAAVVSGWIGSISDSYLSASEALTPEVTLSSISVESHDTHWQSWYTNDVKLAVFTFDTVASAGTLVGLSDTVAWTANTPMTYSFSDITLDADTAYRFVFVKSESTEETLASITNIDEVYQARRLAVYNAGVEGAVLTSEGSATQLVHTGYLPNVTYTVSPVGGDAVPEPTTATLSLLALAGLAARRRRK